MAYQAFVCQLYQYGASFCKVSLVSKLVKVKKIDVDILDVLQSACSDLLMIV